MSEGENIYYGMSGGGPTKPQEEELCNCGLPGCKKTLKQAEDEYRRGVIISACSYNWPLLLQLHRTMKKLQRKYPSFEAAKVDPRAGRLWDKYHDAWEIIQMRVDEELWKIDEYKKKHGRYPGMERGACKDVGIEGTKTV
jgi:hypothetical protein